MIYKPDNEGGNKAKVKVMELLEICQQYQIPMFTTLAISDNGLETEYFNQLYSAKAHNIFLGNDRIEKHVLIAGGFSAVPPREALELNMGSLMSELGGED